MKIFCLIFFALVISIHSEAQKDEVNGKIDSIIQPYIKQQTPGFSIGIIQNGKIIYNKSAGLSDIKNRVPNSDSMIFSIASIAKQLTAACVWSLVRENRISLDDDIRKFIPEFPDYGEPVRIRHMLNHTSGIRNYHAIMQLSGFNYDKEFHDNQTILNLACKQKELNNHPGEKVIYGNTAYTLLAITIERITGQNLDQYAKSRIFRPLGMYHTFYRIDTTTIAPFSALGYIQNDDGSYEHFTSNQLSYGAGSVGSSVKDLYIWSNILNGLNPDYLDLTQFLTTVEPLPSGETAKYARGVMIDDYKGRKMVHHSGYSSGGQSQIIAVPEIGLAIIILTNVTSIDPSPLSYKILDVFLPVQDNESGMAPTLFHHDRKDLNKFVGQYKEQNSDMKLEIMMDKDTLKALGSQGRTPISLVSIGEGKFVRQNNQNVIYNFIPAKNAGSDLIVYFGGAPFYFSKANFINPQSVNLGDYTGRYFSEELSVEYEIYIEKGDLFVNNPGLDKTKLMVGQKDEFGNGQRTLYSFQRNKDNKVTKFYLATEGTVKNIEFNKR